MSIHSLRARFKVTVDEAILNAAEEVSAEVGVAATSLQAVAKRAGVAVGTIYNHFDDREELFAALFARRREELLAALDSAARARSAAKFGTQLEDFVQCVFAFFDSHRLFLRLVLESPFPKALPKAKAAQGSMEQLTRRAERIVQSGLKEKQIRPDAADLAPHFLVAAIRAVLVTGAAEPEPFVARTAQAVDLFLNGTAP
jgi:AcrR family transcriptional regulator